MVAAKSSVNCSASTQCTYLFPVSPFCPLSEGLGWLCFVSPALSEGLGWLCFVSPALSEGLGWLCFVSPALSEGLGWLCFVSPALSEGLGWLCFVSPALSEGPPLSLQCTSVSLQRLLVKEGYSTHKCTHIRVYTVRCLDSHTYKRITMHTQN